MDHSTLTRHIETGLTQKGIAKVEGVSQSTIQYWLRRHGLSTNWKRGGWSKLAGQAENRPRGLKTGKLLTEWDWLGIQKRHDEGVTWNDLHKEFGVNIAAIERAKAAGLFKSRSSGEARKLAHVQGRIDYSPYRTPEFRAKQKARGGYKSKSGSGKGGWVPNTEEKAFYLQSSYEIRLANILNRMKVKWERPGGISYTTEGQLRHYYADFLLLDHNIYIDTKNPFLMKRDTDKIKAVREQNQIDLKILGNESINEDFVKTLLHIT